MADIQVTQGGIEAASEPDVTEIQVTQAGIEAASEPDITEIRVTQGGVEAASEPDYVYNRIAQGGIEVGYLPPGANTLFVSQMGIEFVDRQAGPTPPAVIEKKSVCHPPYAQLLYPIEGGEYAVAPLALMGVRNGTLIVSLGGTGTPPLHYLSQRGPYQQGSTPLDFRWDERTVEMQIFKGNLDNRLQPDWRWRLLDYLRPSRTFYTGVTAPKSLKFRYWLPGGQFLYGNDLELTAGSAIVYSAKGRFVHSGLEVGEQFTIIGSIADDADYRVLEINNDYYVTLSAAMNNTETGVQYQFRMAQAWRELTMLMQQGPDFALPNEVTGGGVSDVITFIAHDPFWYGKEQTQTFNLGTDFDALVFDDPDFDAIYGANPGDGTWLFADNYLSRQVSVVYWGHEPVNPIIDIIGPADVPVIVNVEADVTIIFNYNVAVGESVTIDTLNLTVTNNFGQNLYAYLSGDVATFSLSPDPNAPNRINTISVTFGGATPESAVTIRWQNRYLNL